MSFFPATGPDPVSLSDYDAGPVSGTVIATFDDLRATGSKNLIFTQGDSILQVILHNSPSGVKAFINSCPHARVPLNLFGDQFLDHRGHHFLCQTHGARFDVESGLCVAGPCKGDYLIPVNIKVDGTSIIAL